MDDPEVSERPEASDDGGYMDYLGPRLRAVFPDDDEPAISLRSDGDEPPVMFGYLARFAPSHARIDSAMEGQFIERIAPGAFKKTIADNRRSLKVLYDHGKGRFGRDPIASINVLREDQRGVYFEAELLDTPEIRNELIPRLRAKVLGTSFSFRPTKKPIVEYPTRATDENPDQWPEVTVTELAMKEFGPTPFPHYADATVGLRSITDEYVATQLASDPERLRALLEQVGIALPKPEPASATPVAEAAPAPTPIPQLSKQEWQTWLRSI